MLGLGKREPVRQLKKAGGILILLQQILYTHERGKDKKVESLGPAGRQVEGLDLFIVFGLWYQQVRSFQFNLLRSALKFS